MKYLLDTNVISELRKKSCNLTVKNTIEKIDIGEELIEVYCKKSRKKFKTFEDKLRYCASVMPSMISEGTKYERLERKRI